MKKAHLKEKCEEKKCFGAEYSIGVVQQQKKHLEQ